MPWTVPAQETPQAPSVWHGESLLFMATVPCCLLDDAAIVDGSPSSGARRRYAPVEGLPHLATSRSWRFAATGAARRSDP
jgi:hypothetical protein